MQPMSDAPRDGTPVLVKIKDDLSPWGIEPGHWGGTDRFAGLQAVMRNRDDLSEWCFAAPVGQGGFPDEWLDGWWPLPGAVEDKGTLRIEADYIEIEDKPAPSLSDIEDAVLRQLRDHDEIPETILLEWSEDPTGLMVICDLIDTDAGLYVARAYCPRDQLTAETITAQLRMSYWLYEGRVTVEGAGA